MVKLVGILNLTPDSFSDGGQFNNKEDAIAHVKKLLADGADVIDVGAESTRPNAEEITIEEEWERLEPCLKDIVELVHKNNKEISLDTRNSATAKKAVELGVDYINDVSACSDTEMINVVKDADVKLIINHNLGVPVDPNHTIDDDKDVIEEIKIWTKETVHELENSGVSGDKVILDVGIGFGKNAKQSLEILSRIEEFKDLDLPIYVGHSRKSFMNQFDPKTDTDRDSLTGVFSAKISPFVEYIRVHNIGLNRFMINKFNG